MNKRARRIGLLGIAVLWLGAAPPVLASETSGSYMEGAFRKLGRGLANVVTCPAELIRTPELVGRKDGHLAALSVGILQGAWRTLVRGVVGAAEAVTFLVEIPKDFTPILQPEFVYANGDWAQ